MTSGAKKPVMIPLDTLTRMMLNAELAWRQREHPDSIIHRTDLVREALDFWFLEQSRKRDREGLPPHVFDAMNMKVDLPPEALQ